MEAIRTMWHCGIRPSHNNNRQVKPKETHQNRPELRSCRLWPRFRIRGIAHDCTIRMTCIIFVRDCTETMTSTGSIWHACMHMMTNIPDFWSIFPFSNLPWQIEVEYLTTIFCYGLIWLDADTDHSNLPSSLALISPCLPWSCSALAIWYKWLALIGQARPVREIIDKECSHSCSDFAWNNSRTTLSKFSPPFFFFYVPVTKLHGWLRREFSLSKRVMMHTSNRLSWYFIRTYKIG